MKRFLCLLLLLFACSICSAHKEIEVKIKFSSRQRQKFNEWLQAHAQYTRTLQQKDCYLDYSPNKQAKSMTVFLERSVSFGSNDKRGSVSILDDAGVQHAISVDDITAFADLLEGIGCSRNKKINTNSKKLVFTVQPAKLQTFFVTRRDGIIDCLKTLRVRFDVRGALVCFKKRHVGDDGHTLSRDEFETRVKKRDVGMVMTLFKKLGFEERFVVAKKRSKYDYKGFKIMVDEVEKLGKFVEIECWSTGDDVEVGMKRIYNLLKSIGYKRLIMCDRGYLQMLMNKKKKKLFEEKIIL